MGRPKRKPKFHPIPPPPPPPPVEKARRSILARLLAEFRPLQVLLATVLAVISTAALVPAFLRPKVSVVTGMTYVDFTAQDSASGRLFVSAVYSLDAWCKDVADTTFERSARTWANVEGKLHWLIKFINSGRSPAHGVHARLAVWPRLPSTSWSRDLRSLIAVDSATELGEQGRFYDVVVQTLPPKSSRFVSLQGAVDSSGLQQLGRRRIGIDLVTLSSEETGDLPRQARSHANGITLMLESSATLRGTPGFAQVVVTFALPADRAARAAQKARWLQPLGVPPCLRPLLRIAPWRIAPRTLELDTADIMKRNLRIADSLWK